MFPKYLSIYFILFFFVEPQFHMQPKCISKMNTYRMSFCFQIYITNGHTTKTEWPKYQHQLQRLIINQMSVRLAIDQLNQTRNVSHLIFTQKTLSTQTYRPPPHTHTQTHIGILIYIYTYIYIKLLFNTKFKFVLFALDKHRYWSHANQSNTEFSSCNTA